MATDRVSGPVHELERAHRPALRGAVSPQAAESEGRGGACGETVGGRGMKTLPRVDIAIVGGGWTGLLMAKELGARTGLSVVVLERGVPRKTADYFQGMDELDF